MSVSSEPEATAVRGGIRTVPGLARGLDRILCHGESLFVGAALAFTSLLLFVNVILRYVFLSPIHWAEEATLYLMVWIVFLILVPILLGPVTGAGVGGVHFGIVTTVNADMGNITPPFGLNLFVASGTVDRPYIAVARACLPWLALPS